MCTRQRPMQTAKGGRTLCGRWALNSWPSGLFFIPSKHLQVVISVLSCHLFLARLSMQLLGFPHKSQFSCLLAPILPHAERKSGGGGKKVGFGHFPPFFIPGLPGDDQSPSLSLSPAKHHRKGCPKPSGLELHLSKPTTCQQPRIAALLAWPQSWIPSWDPSTGEIQAFQLIPRVRAHSSSACLGRLKTDALCLVMLCHESKCLEGQRELPPLEMSASWHPKYL